MIESRTNLNNEGSRALYAFGSKVYANVNPRIKLRNIDFLFPREKPSLKARKTMSSRATLESRNSALSAISLEGRNGEFYRWVDSLVPGDLI
jgi:hypothetical protein